MTSTPAAVGWRPKGIASPSRINDWMSSVRMSRAARPRSRASRLQGVTRNLSITPARSSAINPKPTPLAPKRPSWISSPGTKTL